MALYVPSSQRIGVPAGKQNVLRKVPTVPFANVEPAARAVIPEYIIA